VALIRKKATDNCLYSYQ